MPADALLINGTDIYPYARVSGELSGLLDTGPAGGDLIEMDWRPGAVWQAGPPAAYTFDVPLLMAHEDEPSAIADLRWLQAWIGQEITLTTRITEGTAQVERSCRAVIVNVIPSLSFTSRNLLDVTLRVQNLDGGWS